MNANGQQPLPTSNGPARPQDALVHMVGTYRSLRTLLVVVALVFVGIILAYRWFGDDTVTRDSVSAYYHNPGRFFGLMPVRDLFVGSFAAVALMLYAYRGVTKWESRLLDFAAIGLLVVAASPMEWSVPAIVAQDTKFGLARNGERMAFVTDQLDDGDKSKPAARELRDSIHAAHGKAADLVPMLKDAKSQDGLPRTVGGWAHYIGAFAFFGCIMLICWFHTRHTLKWIDDPRVRLKFRSAYFLVGILMGCVPVLATGLYLAGFRATIFWVELAGVGVFVLYWAIKSRELARVKIERTTEAAPPTIQGL